MVFNIKSIKMRVKLILILFITFLTMVIANKRSVTNEHDNFIGNDDKITNCSCVPYYQCSEESGRVITDGDGLLDLRYINF